MIHIIGAGPAGISLAYYAFLSGIKEISLYESTNKIGGMARSWNHHDFILDTGPHIFHTNDNEIATDWLDIGRDLLVNGNFNSCNILENYPNKLFHYPVSLSTLKNNLGEKEYKNICDELDSIRNTDKSRIASNFNEFMEAKMGKTLTKMFFTQYPKKVWGIDTKDMLADWAPQRIELREEDKNFYTKPFVAVGLNGTGCFYDRIIEILSQGTSFNIYLNKKLTNVINEGGIIKKLIFNENEVIDINENDHVFSTIPATTLAKLLGLELSLKFRGVKSEYFFFENNRILPEGYNWVYCSDKAVSFNRITEPPTMTSGVSPKDHSFVCVETTFPGDENFPLCETKSEFIDWLKNQSKFNNKGYKEELYTENYERYVYPIQDKSFRSSLSKYNSLISKLNNLSVLGTGGEFHYSDMQIIFRKSKNLINSFLAKSYNNQNKAIPLITNLDQSPENKYIASKKNIKDKSFKKDNLSRLHMISKVPVPLIAEIGINHNGDINLAKEMMLAAKNSGAHFAKFQYYKKESRIQKNSLTEFLHETAEGNEMSLNDILERSRLNISKCIELIKYGKEIEIPVFFTVFDSDSANEINNLNQNIIKIASMDSNNLELHRQINSLDFKTIIISTGMTNISEILRSISVYDESKEILLMSCRSSYPASLDDIDLGEIKYLITNTNCTVGYSDHTEGCIASLLSVASGATFIERHFTINKSLSGPDNIMSIDQKETAELSKNLQIVSNSISRTQKIIHPCEQGTFSMQKKSFRFPEKKSKGDVIHTDDLISIAPPEGFSAFQSNLPRTFLKVLKDVQPGDPVKSDNVLIMHD